MPNKRWPLPFFFPPHLNTAFCKDSLYSLSPLSTWGYHGSHGLRHPPRSPAPGPPAPTGCLSPAALGTHGRLLPLITRRSFLGARRRSEAGRGERQAGWAATRAADPVPAASCPSRGSGRARRAAAEADTRRPFVSRQPPPRPAGGRPPPRPRAAPGGSGAGGLPDRRGAARPAPAQLRQPRRGGGGCGTAPASARPRAGGPPALPGTRRPPAAPARLRGAQRRGAAAPPAGGARRRRPRR